MMKSFRKLKAEAAQLAAVVAFFVAFFWPAIFSGMCFVSGDALVYFRPMREAAWEMIGGGRLPLRTPHILSGVPLLAMTNLGIGYPLTWGYLFLPGHIAERSMRLRLTCSVTPLPTPICERSTAAAWGCY
jgi:hypothetical protein